MYDPQLLLQAIDANRLPFLAFSSLALVFNYIFFVGAALAARRDRAFAIPLFLAAFWFAHDVSYIVKYDLWFHVYNHWYLKLFWGGLVATTALEAVFLVQLYNYGREELLPNASRQLWTLYVLGAVAVAMVAWLSLRAVMSDPLFAYSFGASGFLTPFLCLRTLLNRGDARGQSVLAWIGYVGMQTTWFATTYLFWGQGFRSAHYVILGATCVAGGLMMTYVVSRTARGRRETSATGHRAHATA
jgi:hypothetical protein